MVHPLTLFVASISFAMAVLSASMGDWWRVAIFTMLIVVAIYLEEKMNARK